MAKINSMEKTHRIRKVALELFAQQGYQNTTIEQIAQSASCSKGLVLYKFQSKKNLLDSILLNSISEILENHNPFNDNTSYNKADDIYIKSMDVLNHDMNFWKLVYLIVFNKSMFNRQFQLIKQKIDVPFNELVTEYFRSNNYNNVEYNSSLFTNLVNGVYVGVLFRNNHDLTSIRNIDQTLFI